MNKMILVGIGALFGAAAVLLGVIAGMRFAGIPI